MSDECCLIGPGLEAIAGLIQSSFKPSPKATLSVTYHAPAGASLSAAELSADGMLRPCGVDRLRPFRLFAG